MVARISPRNTKQEVEEFTTEHETGSRGADLSSLNDWFESLVIARMCNIPVQGTDCVAAPTDGTD